MVWLILPIAILFIFLEWDIRTTEESLDSRIAIVQKSAKFEVIASMTPTIAIIAKIVEDGDEKFKPLLEKLIAEHDRLVYIYNRIYDEQLEKIGDLV
jgi:hypothetical protein